jgi:hypothetical protein
MSAIVRTSTGGIVNDSTKEAARSTGLRRVRIWSAGITAALAAIAFSVAATTPPRTGPFAAPGTALAYPYSAAAQFVPRDFFWMYPALAMMVAFVVLAACIREYGKSRGVFGTVGFGIAVAAMTVIAADYAIQLRTVQPALMNREFDGLAIISQYNPHGVFIALEELGFLLAGVSFLFLGLALGSAGLERWVRRVLVGSSSLVAASLAGLSVAFGMGIEYRFEVAAITIVWLTLVVVGLMLMFVFARHETSQTHAGHPNS